MSTVTFPVRRGKPVCFTLDHDAETLLRAMSPNSKGIGLFLSELVRREAERRAQRHELLRVLALDVGKGARHE
jgi:hypothetical protein